jgi:hypothetical protein
VEDEELRRGVAEALALPLGFDALQTPQLLTVRGGDG